MKQGLRLLSVLVLMVGALVALAPPASAAITDLIVTPNPAWVGETVTLTLAVTSDVNRVEVDWGDKTGVVVLEPVVSPVALSHVYGTSSAYTLAVTAFSTVSKPDVRNVAVSVQDNAVSSFAVTPNPAYTRETVTATIVFDMGGVAEVDWGDGTSSAPKPWTPGLPTVAGHEYLDPGDYTVVVTLRTMVKPIVVLGTGSAEIHVDPVHLIEELVVEPNPVAVEAELTLTATLVPGAAGIWIDWGDGSSYWLEEPVEKVYHQHAYALAGSYRLYFETWAMAGGRWVYELREVEVVVVDDTTAPVITPVVTGTLGSDGWYVSDVELSWDVTDPESEVTSTVGCEKQTVSADGTYPFACSATSAGGDATDSVTIRRDVTSPVVAFTGHQPTYGVDETIDIGCTASDPEPASGLVSSTCPTLGPVPAHEHTGTTTLTATATDVAGHTTTVSVTFTVEVTADGTEALIEDLFGDSPTADTLIGMVHRMADAPNAASQAGQLRAFDRYLAAQTGKTIGAEDAATLSRLARLL